ncbi:MAG TPA: hypothetical protein VJN19_00520 [Propionibacteriaceae bacterium]|nr:hypothetical protein [Propionibacteriaceae bacterium]
MRRRRRRPDPAPAELTTEERAALELLERANGHLLGADWMVGRTIGRSLARRRLVFVMDEFVFLTDAGRDVLSRPEPVQPAR